MHHRSRILGRAGVATALAVGGALALPTTPATAVSDDVVISEVYGGGGNSGATLTNDFIELYNAGSAPVDVTGWSVQYGSSGGDTWNNRTVLSGSIPAGAYYLVQESQGNGGTAALPTADTVGTINMSGSKGKVALVTTSAELTCGTDCAETAAVKDFVGYGSANDFEGSAPAPGLENETSDSRVGADTDDNAADFVEGEPTPTNTAGEGGAPEPPPAVEGLTIHDIQGAAQLSPYEGERVADVAGQVTAVTYNGFWMQSSATNDDPATSEGIFVFTGSDPTVAVGDDVTVTATVEEYRAGNDNLTTTELSDPTVTVVGTATAAPEPTLVGPGGRVPPAKVVENDASGSVENQDAFDPAEDGIDFWESMEGMLVAIDDAQVVGPTSRFGETPVVPVGSGPRTIHDGIVISADDFNPERVLLDDVLSEAPVANTGDVLAGRTVGVLDYSFANFKLLPATTPTVVDGGLTRESTTGSNGSQLSIASYNVENLDPTDPQEKFDALAAQIVDNLDSPDILGIEEIQDNDGAENTDVTAADETLRLLTEAIVRAGGPQYEWRQIDPVEDQEGGEPGGNIRVGFLFQESHGLKFVDRGTPSSTEGTEVFSDRTGAHITRSPGRIDPTSSAWDDSRVPLVGEFTFKGETVFVIANHFSSKGGDDPLFGRWQPPVFGSEVQRHAQAREVRGFVDELLAADPDARVAVVGDINDFAFSQTVDILVGDGDSALTDLPRTLPKPERYTYVYEGNSEVLDHILLSPELAGEVERYDVVHVNAEFVDQISDHDPQVVTLENPHRP